jgi:hypothetical protein
MGVVENQPLIQHAYPLRLTTVHDLEMSFSLCVEWSEQGTWRPLGRFSGIYPTHSWFTALYALAQP